MKLLKYAQTQNERSESEMERRVQQLVLLAKALASEVETLQAELARDNNQSTPINLDSSGIDFYREVERYEIDLIRRALGQCGGNQTRAAGLLGMKPTTLNAKMKHYGLNPVRPIVVQRTNAEIK